MIYLSEVIQWQTLIKIFFFFPVSKVGAKGVTGTAG
jgi:hypothetical protein